MNVHVCLTVEAKLRRVATNKRTFFLDKQSPKSEKLNKESPPVFYLCVA